MVKLDADPKRAGDEHIVTAQIQDVEYRIGRREQVGLLMDQNSGGSPACTVPDLQVDDFCSGSPTE